MDLNGQIIWMKTFGGTGIDRNHGVSYRASDNTVFATGFINDTLNIDNVFHSINQQSAIVLQYSSTGTYFTHKLYDFVTERNIGILENNGWEIEAKNSDIFLLMDQDGYDWDGTDTVVAPLVGKYLYKLNASLDTLWSLYIIGPSCYYGWEAHSLELADNGDVYLSKHCAAHYGGLAELLRVNGSTGAISMSFQEDDGHYRDLKVDGNMVYLTGTEGAFACPCPSADPGYQVVKIIDQSNTVIGETRFENASTSFITTDMMNNIVITGYFNDRELYMGPDTLIGDSTLSFGIWTYEGQFLSKFGTILCVAPEITISEDANINGDFMICPGDNLTLTVSPVMGTYEWSTGETTTSIIADTTALYYVVNTQPNGCIAYSVRVLIQENTNNESHEICMVTYDSAMNRNKIIVRPKTIESQDMVQVNLYKDVAGTPTLISSAFGNTGSGPLMIDTVSDPNTGFVDYSVTTIDSCGTMSMMSPVHRSIYLTVIQDGTGKNILNWNSYVGTTYLKYQIYRGMTPSTMALYDSVNVPTTTYTDNLSAGVNYYYAIRAVKFVLDNCYVSPNYYGPSWSNTRNPTGTTGISSVASGSHLNVLPNPAQEEFTISYDSDKPTSLLVLLHNSLGEIIYREQIQKFSGEYNKRIDMSRQAKGIYFLELITDNQHLVKKVIRQ